MQLYSFVLHIPRNKNISGYIRGADNFITKVLPK